MFNDESRGFLDFIMAVCTCKVSVTRFSTNNFNPGSITSPKGKGCNDYENPIKILLPSHLSDIDLSLDQWSIMKLKAKAFHDFEHGFN